MNGFFTSTTSKWSGGIITTPRAGTIVAHLVADEAPLAQRELLAVDAAGKVEQICLDHRRAAAERRLRPDANNRGAIRAVEACNRAVDAVGWDQLVRRHGE